MVVKTDAPIEPGKNSWNPFSEEANDRLPQGRESLDQHSVFAEKSRNLTTEVRESVSRSIQDTFPGPVAVLLEALVTWVSGCPHSGQKPLFTRSKLVYAIEAFGGFVAVICLSQLALLSGLWYLLPILWLLLAGRSWALFIIFHHATHGNLFASARVNRALAFCSSILTYSSSLDSYYEEHVRSHHTRAMCTYDDQEAPFLALGFPPGAPKRYYYRRLAWLIFSPFSYLAYARYRLWDWQRGTPWLRKGFVWSLTAGLVFAAVWFHFTASLLLVYVIPMFVVFNITGLIGTFSEHHWGTLLDEPARVRLALLQQSRFLLDPAPDRGLPVARRVAAWIRWWLRLVCYHLPVRIAVLPGDSMHHDHHHRHPRTEQWTASTFERFEHLRSGCPGWAAFPHTHAWSLGEAIDRVFTRMAAAPPPPPAHLGRAAGSVARKWRLAAGDGADRAVDL